MTLAGLALAYSGSVAFALAMDRHHEQVFECRPSAIGRVALRLAGVALLVGVFVAATMSRSASIGAVEVVLAGSIGALMAAFALPYAPRLAAMLALAAVPAALFDMILNG
jgi:hypothetical protein